MGNSASFQTIQNKYHKQGVDYVAAKYQQRKVYERINDQIARLKENANLQQREDLSFINQQRGQLEHSFKKSLDEAEAKKPGSIKEAQAKSKQKVENFSGYNEQLQNLDRTERDVKQKYEKERIKMQEKVRQQVKNHQQSSSTLKTIPQYDNHPDNYKRNIQNELIKKYPDRVREISTTQLERKLTWVNYKQNFESILDRQKLKDNLDTANRRIRDNVVPGSAPICC